MRENDTIPCPFCGDDEIEIHDKFADSRDAIPTAWCVCDECGAEGPIACGDDLDEAKVAAVDMWNQRVDRSEGEADE